MHSRKTKQQEKKQQQKVRNFQFSDLASYRQGTEYSLNNIVHGC